VAVGARVGECAVVKTVVRVFAARTTPRVRRECRYGVLLFVSAYRCLRMLSQRRAGRYKGVNVREPTGGNVKLARETCRRACASRVVTK